MRIFTTITNRCIISRGGLLTDLEFAPNDEMTYLIHRSWAPANMFIEPFNTPALRSDENRNYKQT